jgi:hypothetical protein
MIGADEKSRIPVQGLQYVGGPMKITMTETLDCYQYSNITEILVSNFSCVSNGEYYSRGLTPTPIPQAKLQSKTNVGAIAGGVVGGIFIFGIALGVAFWFWRRRRQRDQTPAYTAAASGDDAYYLQDQKGLEQPLSEMESEEKGWQKPEELDTHASEIREMDSKEPVRELDATADIAELGEPTTPKKVLQRQTWSRLSDETARDSVPDEAFERPHSEVTAVSPGSPEGTPGKTVSR